MEKESWRDLLDEKEEDWEEEQARLQAENEDLRELLRLHEDALLSLRPDGGELRTPTVRVDSGGQLWYIQNARIVSMRNEIRENEAETRRLRRQNARATRSSDGLARREIA